VVHPKSDFSDAREGDSLALSERQGRGATEEAEMSRNGGQRKYPVEEKLRILEEARQPNTTVAEVLRRHQVDPATFYRWEKQAREGMKRALEGRTGDTKALEREVERLRGEVEKKSRIIAEVVEENLGLKRGL
jgi:transposase-like protein